MALFRARIASIIGENLVDLILSDSINHVKNIYCRISGHLAVFLFAANLRISSKSFKTGIDGADGLLI